MDMSIRHKATPRKDSLEFWDWEAWIEAAPSVLDSIQSVEYFLHESYPRPHRESKSRSSRFKISSYGWGEFRLRATVHLKTGANENLERWVSFRAKGSQDNRNVKKVFMSYAASDSRVAQAARLALEADGIKVVSPEDLIPGIPWKLALKKEIQDSDAMLVITPENASDAIDAEITMAIESKKTVLPVSFYTRNETKPTQLTNVQELRIKNVSDIAYALQDLSVD